MRKRRILSWLLALVMAVSLMPSGAYAEEADGTEEIGVSPAGETPSGIDSGRSEEPLDESGAEPCRYILYLTHTLRWTTAEGGRFIQEDETIILSEADFADGGIALLQLARVHEALAAAPAPSSPEILRPEDFYDYDGVMECGAAIYYTLLDGWEMRFPTDKTYDGPSFRGVYEGVFNEVEFVPARSITVTINYEYSRTGGLAGTQAHAPDVIELVLDETGTANLVNWRVPHYEADDQDYHGHSHDNLKGFRIVLNPAPLDQFLVKPPSEYATPEELENALNNGGFNLRPDVNTDSLEYKLAWDDARTATVDGVTFTYIAPTENGGTAATTSGDPAAQYTLCAEGLTQDIELTVYFRRDTGSYTVKHWKPKDGVDDPDQGNPDDWVPVKTEANLPGRNGALTDAEALDTTTDANGIQSYRALPFSQKTIEADGSTVVDIYYIPDAIRVIFDTDDIYIERQQVLPGGDVDLSAKTIDPEALNNAKAGYTFDGWQYKDKNEELQNITLDDDDKFNLTQAFLNSALLEGSAEAAGVQVLRLYPKWKPAPTTIRVTLWTEDLNGHDVTVTNTFYDFENQREDTREPEEEIIHQVPAVGGSFTNVGSFEMKDVFTTDQQLVAEDGKLVKQIQDEIQEHLNMLGTETVKGNNDSSVMVDISDFYKQMDVFTILTEVVDPITGEVSETTTETTAAANGTTQVYVYFARKEYTLEFHYYFTSEQVGCDSSKGRIYTNTDGFSSIDWIWPSNGLTSNALPSSGIGFDDIAAERINQEKIPQKTTIRAKYGADLRDVWPSGMDSRFEMTDLGKMRVSWAPTAGLQKTLKIGGNANIPGAYSTMSPAVVANVNDSDEINHLVSYWTGTTNNVYRYNYCYEVPDLQLEGAIEVKIYDGIDHAVFNATPEEEKNRRNTIYLVPKSNSAFTKWGFTDLLTADQLELPSGQKLPTEANGGSQYYVVRKYTDANDADGEKYYAVSRQLVALAAKPIGQLNPSARPYLGLVNTTADHSTEFKDDMGCNNEPGNYNTLDNPYDIYFYYTRERFTVTYMTGTREIGQIELPYGTTMDKNKYGFDLEYDKTNGYYQEKFGWSLQLKDESTSLDSNLPVCPDRATDGKKAWRFLGWGLSPSGERMMDWGNESAPVTLSGNLRLYACWEAPVYTVEFDWNGGSSINNENAAPKVQSIPANRSFSSSGQIPRLTREGYTMTGWLITHEGENQTPVSETKVFEFEKPISQNLWVQAQWVASGEVDITYTVRYWVAGTDTPVRAPQTVTKTFLPGAVIWESPKSPTVEAYKNYVPLEQNKSVTLDTDTENVITFYYAPPPEYRYEIQYVVYGTSQLVWKADPITTSDVSVQVTPSEAHIQKLNELGYYLADDTGERAAAGTAMWRLVEPAVSGSGTAVFYVLPETYTIEYRNLEVMGAAAAGLNNPGEYRTANGAGTLNNPGESYVVDGRTITFLGWMMVDTSEVGGTRNFTDGATISQTVDVEAGSRGNLIFRAVWSPEVYTVSFYPGEHGSLPENAAEISYGGIPGNTVLKNHTGFTVPAAAPAQGYIFTGWKLEEGGGAYTALEVQDVELVDCDLHFTAQYEAEKPSPTPPVTPAPPDWPVPPSNPAPDPVPDPAPASEPVSPEPEPLIARPTAPDTGMVPYDPVVILDDIVPLAAPHLNITDHIAYITGYPDGDVRPEGNITRAEAATIFFRLMLDEYRQENWAVENSFSDVSSGDWFNNAVSTCAKAGIINGYEDGTFRPDATITRAEFAAIAARFVSSDVPGYDYFTDMDGHWARMDVARAVMAGWIRGEGRLFRPEDHLTRAETAVLVNRMICRFPDKEHLLPDMIRWPDNPENAWFYEDIQEATNSHDYDMPASAFSEIWKTLLPNRDWAELEKEWADAFSAPGGEVAPDLRR